MSDIRQDWITMEHALFMLTVGILILTPCEACRVVRRHPQEEFCDVDFVIKATVKETDVIFGLTSEEETNLLPETNSSDSDRPPADGARYAGRMTDRVYFVKVKKYYKYTEQYGLAEAVHKDNETNLLSVYTPVTHGACGADLDLKTTYLLQGYIYENKPYIYISPEQRRWNQEELPVYTRKALGRHYQKTCGACNVTVRTNGVKQPNECIWDRRGDTSGCFAKHSVCVKRQNSDHCKWTKPASLQACLQKSSK